MKSRNLSEYSVPRIDIIELMTENSIMTSSKGESMLGELEDNVFGEEFI